MCSQVRVCVGVSWFEGFLWVDVSGKEVIRYAASCSEEERESESGGERSFIMPIAKGRCRRGRGHLLLKEDSRRRLSDVAMARGLFFLSFFFPVVVGSFV